MDDVMKVQDCSGDKGPICDLGKVYDKMNVNFSGLEALGVELLQVYSSVLILS